MRDRLPFLFSTLPGKGGKLSKIFENKDDEHWPSCYDFRFPRIFFIVTYYSQRDLTLGVFLEILALKKFVFL